MIVVGVGCGPGLLTQQALAVLSKTAAVYGSRRAIELVADHLPTGCITYELTEFGKLSHLPEDAVLLSTGDPMLAGLGRQATKVVPGISSFQVACARLGVPWEMVTIVSAHHGPVQKAVDRAAEKISQGQAVFMLATPGLDIEALARYLLTKKIRCRIAVLEELGYANELITLGTSEQPPQARSKLFSLFLGEW
jgi:cobalt-precorrin-7 (C5)-methyltransferase